MSPPELLQLLAMVLTAGATWGALRADIRALVQRVAATEQRAADAHDRLDTLLMQRRTGD